MKNYEGETMKKLISEVLPNIHRDFSIYPIGEAQVDRLVESIKEVGMFLGLPARKTKKGYEIAAGHHRLEALKRTGATHVDLAVKDYSDDDMLKIMIRENNLQRGDENFGAVLDSVGAVLVACVKDIYGPNKKSTHNPTNISIKASVETTGSGVGVEAILGKEPSLQRMAVKHALSTLRNTGTYLILLKKGGLPEEFWHLYEKPQITTIDAVAMFSKPAHAAEWVKQVDGDVFKQRFSVDQHQAMVADIIRDGDATGVTVPAIREYINKKINPNMTMDSDEEKEEKSIDELSDELTKAIKALFKKIMRFKEDKGDRDCYFENIEPIINPLIEDLEWVMDCRKSDTINV